MLSLLFCSCAQMLPLSGGERDVAPPKVIDQFPANKTINFSGDEIRIDFDEYIQLRDIQNQLIITPRLSRDPEVTAAAKTLRLKFKEPLQPNTTYNVNFGASVSDIHEGNTLSSLTVIFSTGNLLDSLNVSGKIVDAFTLKPAADVSVFLYVNGDDSCMFRRKPDYFTKAERDGTYRINFIKEGNYKIIAIGDKNKNFTYEQGEEFIAPASLENKSRKLLSRDEVFNFEVYREEPPNFYLKKTSYPVFGKTVYTFNKSLKDPELEFKSKRDVLDLVAWSFSKQKDSLIVNYRRGIPDTVAIMLSQSGKVIDTLYLYAQSEEKYEKDVKTKKLNPLLIAIAQNKKEGGLQLFFNEPVSFNTITGKILQVVGKDTSIVVSLPKASGDYLVIGNDFSKAIKGTIVFLPGAVQGFAGISNDTIKKDFEIKTKEDFATLILTVSPPAVEGNYFLEIIDERGNTYGDKIKIVSNEKHVSEKIILDWITPGIYSLRLTKDDNNDLQWTSGNFMKEIAPEKVYFYTKAIKLLSDWEINVEWEVKE